MFQSLDRLPSLSGNGGGIGGLKKLVCLSSSINKEIKGDNISGFWKVHDEEDELPFPDDCFDVVVCNMCLQWVNDLEGVLKEVNRILKPDGAVFLR